MLSQGVLCHPLRVESMLRDLNQKGIDVIHAAPYASTNRATVMSTMGCVQRCSGGHTVQFRTCVQIYVQHLNSGLAVQLRG